MKQAKWLLLLILIVSTSPVWGAQLEGGSITADTIWTLAESPYQISGDIVVEPGVTLQIEPGVEVFFTQINEENGKTNRAELIVRGRLQALGMLAHPIRFSAAKTGADLGDWGGIFLEGVENDLTYVQIDHADTALTISGQARVRWSTFNHNLEMGLYITTEGRAEITGNQMTYNRVGLFIEGDGSISQNHFLSNSYGLLAVGVGGLFFVENSFESNNYGIYLEGLTGINTLEKDLISGNDYGIYVDGGHPPTVHYNDIYNNGLYNFYHRAIDDVEAQRNWWGTVVPEEIDQFIFDQQDSLPGETLGEVIYDDFLTASALAPTILRVDLTPPETQGGLIRGLIVFSKEMDTIVEPKIEYGLFEPYTGYQLDPDQGRWISKSQYQFELEILPDLQEGQYRLRISQAKSEDDQELQINVNYTFAIDRTPPMIRTLQEEFALSPNGDGRGDSLTVPVFFSEPAHYSYQILEASSQILGSIQSSDYTDQVEIRWDGRKQDGAIADSGPYQLVVEARDRAGNLTDPPAEIPVYIDLTPPTLALESLPGYLQSGVEIQGQIFDEHEPVTQLAYRPVGGDEWTELVELTGNRSGQLYTWDLVGLADGSYELKAIVHDLAGNQSTEIIQVTVDVNEPEVQLTQPIEESHLAGEVIFTGSVWDYYLQEWRLMMEVGADWVELARGMENLSGELARMDTTNYSDGRYRFRLVAIDVVGREKVQERKFYIDNGTPPVLDFINVQPAHFSPNTDGIKDQVLWQGQFSEPVSWQLEVYNLQGMLVNHFLGEGKTLEVSWNGLDESQHLVLDGEYTYSIAYQDQVGHLGMNDTGLIWIDTQPPSLRINQLPVITSATNLTVTGEVTDQFQLLMNGVGVVVRDGIFAHSMELVEGENDILVVARDHAGNEVGYEETVILDTTNPIIDLDWLKELTNQSQIEISGRVDEANLEIFQLELINELGEQVQDIELTSGGEFSLDVELAIGQNQFSFVAVDQAGNQGEVVREVQYLPSVPEIYLLQPANPYLPTGEGQMVLKVLAGSVPIDEDSFTLTIDGQSLPFNWDSKKQLLQADFPGLTEGEHLLQVGAANMAGQVGGGLKVPIIVDLTNPTVQIENPTQGEILDGWDGDPIIQGQISDTHLRKISVVVLDCEGQERLINEIQVANQQEYTGTIATWSLGDWKNDIYHLEIRAEDLSGRETRIQRSVEIRNTGQISGKVLGDLDQLTEHRLQLVQGEKSRGEIEFDPLLGDFTARIPVGSYDLVLAPWGYSPVVLPGVEVKVGETVENLTLVFDADLEQAFSPGKQLLGIPWLLTEEPSGVALNETTLTGWTDEEYYSLDDWTALEVGRGYWLNSQEELYLTFVGHPLPKEEFRLQLESGWNLIATPYNYPYPVEGLTFLRGGENYSYVEAARVGLVDAGIWQYQFWYRITSCLEPWQGYWLYVPEATTLIFSPEQIVKTLQESNPAGFERNRLQSPAWRIQIWASLGRLRDMENYLGTDLGVGSAIDVGKDLREPPPFAPDLSFYFITPEGEQLATSLQNVLQGGQKRKWPAGIWASTTGWVRLAWSIEPESIVYLELTDQVTGQKIDMLSQSSYEFYYQAGEEYPLIITAEKGDFQLQRAYNFPNPFSVTGLKKGTRIRYLLSHDATIQMEIFDVMGRLVKRFRVKNPGQKGAKEGWNEYYWDGKNGQGQRVASGVYILQIRAQRGGVKQVQRVKMAVINGR